MITALRIHPDDNVICLLRDHDRGEVPCLAEATDPSLSQAVPLGHKVALLDIETGQPVFKYGAIIGKATCPIARGDHVHLHNLESAPP